MITTLETLTLAGHHPDAGTWPMLLAASAMALYVLLSKVRR